MKSEFLEKVLERDASLKNRTTLSQMALTEPALIQQLIELAFDIQTKNHHKALWVIEMVASKDVSLIAPYIGTIAELARTLQHESAIRACSRTLYLYVAGKQVKKSVEKKIIATCFDWLISPKTRIAAKVFSIKTLQLLSEKHKWVFDDLIAIIDKDIHKQGPGYRSAAKRVLKKINL